MRSFRSKLCSRLVAALCGLLLAASSFGASGVTLQTSDPRLATAFDWARRQALAYSFEGDPVGDWYEAALPGREAFCMRDTAHQAAGAQFLDLGRHTRNMLRRFAENTSESKDWASYWEINRYNLPAPVDYKDDTQFWYNLPANFDLLDACYRMYVWTGDSTYLSDPAFKNFYKRTVHEYVERWDLSLDRIMTRQRIMNTRGHPDPANRFQTNRGIPSYDEADPNFVVAVDQVAVQYAGYLAYARLAAFNGDARESADFLARAQDLKSFLNTTWWNSRAGNFYSRLSLSHKLEGQGLNQSILYYGAAEQGEKSSAVLHSILDAANRKQEIGIEEQSHLPEILYRYAESAAAYEQILDLTREDKDRREYPEVSFSVIGAIVTGLMGLDIESATPSQALADGGYVEGPLVTTSHLTPQTQWAEINSVPVRANRIRLRHDGLRKSALENLSGPALIWKACFSGSFSELLVDTRAVKATAAKRQNQEISCVSVPVAPGNVRTVRIPE